MQDLDLAALNIEETFKRSETVKEVYDLLKLEMEQLNLGTSIFPDQTPELHVHIGDTTGIDLKSSDDFIDVRMCIPGILPTRRSYMACNNVRDEILKTLEIAPVNHRDMTIFRGAPVRIVIEPGSGL